MSNPEDPFKIKIPGLIKENPRESGELLEQTARIIAQSRAERLREKNRPTPPPQVNAPLFYRRF